MFCCSLSCSNSTKSKCDRKCMLIAVAVLEFIEYTTIYHVNFCPQHYVVWVWQSILEIQAGSRRVDCGVKLGTVQSYMGKGMDTCAEYRVRYTSVSGDILKTTSSKETELQLAWKILPPQIWDCTSFIHGEYMERLDTRFFTPLKPEQNFMLTRCLDAAF